MTYLTDRVWLGSVTLFATSQYIKCWYILLLMHSKKLKWCTNLWKCAKSWIFAEKCCHSHTYQYTTFNALFNCCDRHISELSNEHHKQARCRLVPIRFWIRQLYHVTRQHPEPAGPACWTFGRRFSLCQLWNFDFAFEESIGQKKRFYGSYMKYWFWDLRNKMQ